MWKLSVRSSLQLSESSVIWNRFQWPDEAYAQQWREYRWLRTLGRCEQHGDFRCLEPQLPQDLLGVFAHAWGWESSSRCRGLRLERRIERDGRWEAIARGEGE